MKKNIYLVQASSQHVNVMPLPYAVGVLHAYILKNREITEQFEFPEYLFEKTEVSIAAEKMIQPYAVFFSCYIWNYEYHKQLAQEILKRFPETILVFGGHNVPMDVQKAFRELPFANFIIIGEGERPFEDLLLYFLGKKTKYELLNTAYKNEDGQIIYHFDPSYTTDVFYSPYQYGLFDSILKKSKGKYVFSATLETNRGCPFSCGYCDWGLNRAKLRLAPEEQVCRDIQWMAENKISDCYGADSNFGMFDRDIRFAKLFAKCKEYTGYPRTFYVSFSKNSDNNVLEIAAILQNAGMLQGATLSFQSLNPDTLKVIGRKNLDLGYFRSMMNNYHKRRIPTYSELILGLPMETKESFRKGIGILMECGQHSSIDVYEYCLLPNSDLGQSENIKKYGLVSIHMPFRRFDVLRTEEIQEYSDIVVETSTMSKADWIDCNVFQNIVSVLHYKKLFHYTALYLYNEYQLPYEKIYDDFLNKWEHGGGVWQELVQRIRDQLQRISEGQDGWRMFWKEEMLEGVSFKEAIIKVIFRYFDEFIEQTEQYLSSYCETQEMARQITRYQALCIKSKADREYTLSDEFNYRFTEYFDALYIGEKAELKQERCIITSLEVRTSVSEST